MIHLICALDCEAAPLLAAFKMRHDSQVDTLKTYLSKGGNVSLSVSGVGKNKSAVCIEKIAAYYSTHNHDVWLNIGLAGHKDIAIGEALLVHSITEAETGKVWYPQIIFNHRLKSAALITLDKPSVGYTDFMFDMEAAGFYRNAITHSSAELVHCIKIISDNSTHPARKLDKKSISSLIQKQIKQIEQVINELSQLSEVLNSDNSMSDNFDRFCSQWHFSQYQRHRLQQVLNRWTCCCPELDPLHVVKDNVTDSNRVLEVLEVYMDACPIRFNV